MENLIGVITILVILICAIIYGWKRQRELYKKFEEEEGLTLEEDNTPTVEDNKVEDVSETKETTESEETTEETKKYTPKRRTRKPYKKSNKHKKD